MIIEKHNEIAANCRNIEKNNLSDLREEYLGFPYWKAKTGVEYFSRNRECLTISESQKIDQLGTSSIM
jgi:hypothetical protein